MLFHVFQRFDDERGEKWETVEWDVANPSYKTASKLEWLLKHEWRMPSTGILFFPHPTDDESNVEYAYDLPFATIKKFEPGVLNRPSYFTDELKAEVDTLPAELTMEIGVMTLTFKKEELVDTLECNVFGQLFMYRLVKIMVQIG